MLQRACDAIQLGRFRGVAADPTAHMAPVVPPALATCNAIQPWEVSLCEGGCYSTHGACGACGGKCRGVAAELTAPMAPVGPAAFATCNADCKDSLFRPWQLLAEGCSCRYMAHARLRSRALKLDKGTTQQTTWLRHCDYRLASNATGVPVVGRCLQLCFRPQKGEAPKKPLDHQGEALQALQATPWECQ